MNYSEILHYYSPAMKQDQMIEVLTEELYSNNYKLMEMIIEEYVSDMNMEQLSELEKFIKGKLSY